VFTEFVENEISVWKDFHDFWLNSKVPVHIMRFEDILSDANRAYTNLMKFILNKNKLDGTVIAKHIELAVGGGAP
jgi:hypothetical protein